MILITTAWDKYIVGTTPVIRNKGNVGYCCDVVKKDVPEDILKEMRETDQDWREDHGNRPRYIFPDDPDYEKHLASLRS